MTTGNPQYPPLLRISRVGEVPGAFDYGHYDVPGVDAMADGLSRTGLQIEELPENLRAYYRNWAVELLDAYFGAPDDEVSDS